MEIANLQHFSHECPLTLVSWQFCASLVQEELGAFGATIDRLIMTGICDLCRCKITSDDETVYGCSKCPKFFLHQRCAKLPREINHPFHPQHPLMLFAHPPYGSGEFKCHTCGDTGNYPNYHCSQCDFVLDHTCASLATINNATNPDDDKSTLTHPVYEHEHPLIPCTTTTIVAEEQKHVFRCKRCFLPIQSELIYVCLECPMVAHKFCSDFPAQIQHPSHPHHSLAFSYEGDDFRSHFLEECSACRFDLHSFMYRCWDCDFKLHMECALPMPTVKFKLHRHPLTFFIDSVDYSKGCDQCGDSFDTCRSRVFCCVKCKKFKMHLHCVPTLPLTVVNHKFHLHPLTLTKSPVRYSYYDDDNQVHSLATLYCDACETERDLNCPTYYCSKCHYVAHIHCVISQDILALGEEEICVIESDNMEEIEELTKELEELEYERKRMISELASLDEKVEKLTAKLEELKQGE